MLFFNNWSSNLGNSEKYRGDLRMKVAIYRDEDGWYVANALDVQGCATQGKTVKQALERIKEAIKVCKEN